MDVTVEETEDAILSGSFFSYAAAAVMASVVETAVAEITAVAAAVAVTGSGLSFFCAAAAVEIASAAKILTNYP